MEYKTVLFIIILCLFSNHPFISGQENERDSVLSGRTQQVLSGEVQELSDKIQQRASELSAAFRNASEQVIPATVKVISHLQTTEDREAMQIQIPALRTLPGQRNPGDSAGTGILIDPKGIVLTNNHVIARAKEIEAELPDGRKYYAKKYRHDPETDLAVIWLDVPETDDLPYAVFGNSDTMEIGDWVLAIGNPFELDSTVSAGIISAKGRLLKQVQRTEFLQTDAAINPGNSGGPLINLKGEIIGINTAILSRTGTNQGIGFALPSNNAQWVAQQIIAKGKVERAWLGVITKPLTPWEIRRLALKQRTGVLVEYPLQNSPAEKAGLKEDDVILSFDGQPVNAVYQLQRLSERAKLDKEHEIIFIRDGKRYKIIVDMKPMPPSAGLIGSMLGNSVQSYVDTALNLLLIQATEPILVRLKLSGRQGLVVLTTIPDGRAEKAGIRVGTLITKVDGKAVPTRNAYIAARNESDLSNGITLDVVLPGGEEQKIVIRLGQ
ncbi:MAG: trypsin-like peptidase domain-containing protein [Planctomycetaceae bacterium]|jgi:serine protease Do|nr:trypsin-like peptidase domain-containing protein [Planctomycetaceae bacterium]